MLEGVRILIARMEVSPEDFVGDGRGLEARTPRFYSFARALSEVVCTGATPDLFIHLTSEEKTALLIAYRKMMRQAFTAQVIARTFAEKDENEVQAKQYAVPGGGYVKAVVKAPGAPIAYYGQEMEYGTANAQINPWR